MHRRDITVTIVRGIAPVEEVEHTFWCQSLEELKDQVKSMLPGYEMIILYEIGNDGKSIRILEWADSLEKAIRKGPLRVQRRPHYCVRLVIYETLEPLIPSGRVYILPLYGTSFVNLWEEPSRNRFRLKIESFLGRPIDKLGICTHGQDIDEKGCIYLLNGFQDLGYLVVTLRKTRSVTARQ
jgi:hypothetical protein